MRNSDFLTLLQHLPVAIYRFTMTPVWKFEFLNNGIYFVSGYPLSYFSGDTPHDYASLIHPDDTEIRLKTITNRMLQGKPYTVEYRIRQANGRFAWGNEEGRPFTDGSGKSQFIGNIVDITHKKRVIETYRLNESRLSSLLDLNQMTDIPLNEITEYALEQAIQLTRSKIGYCAFVNPGERIIRMYSWSKMAIKNCQIKHKKNT
ncbi:MAG: PAS domain-containing protein, partial [Desulfobacterales bacterium]|nr:PAS domain-containing protein [Desulfobacterales bacterium]